MCPYITSHGFVTQCKRALSVNYLTPVSGALPPALPVEYVLRCSAVDWVTLQVWAEPARRVVVEEALRLLEALPLVPRQARVRQLSVQVVKQLKRY